MIYESEFKTRNWIEAVKKTIEHHQESIASNIPYGNFETSCPLCKMASSLYSIDRKCINCIWFKMTGDICDESEYMDNEKSIIRLSSWLEALESDLGGL